MAVSSEVNPSIKEVMDQINQQSGKTFDKAYLDWGKKDSNSFMEYLQEKAKLLTDRELAQFAATSASTVKNTRMQQPPSKTTTISKKYF